MPGHGPKGNPHKRRKKARKAKSRLKGKAASFLKTMIGSK